MHLNILPKLWLTFGSQQQKIQKMSHFWRFHDHNSRCKHDNQTNDPIFVIYSLSSVHLYISFSHFSIFKFHTLSQYPRRNCLSYRGKWQIFKTFPGWDLVVNFPPRRQKNPSRRQRNSPGKIWKSNEVNW